MNKIIKFGFIMSILVFTLGIPLIIFIGFMGDIVLFSVISAVVLLIISISFFRHIYPHWLVVNRKSERWCTTTLSNEELEIVEDAKELIKSVDNQIAISSFSVYKVKFVTHPWFYYDEDTHELCIFIPFNFLLRLGGKDLCFMAVLHEILHSQNLKNNLNIFNIQFLEGLNQLLTKWLINNYSKKYNTCKDISFSLMLTKHLSLKIGTFYAHNVNMVTNILQEANIDFKEVFLKYIDFQPEFFKSFVPSEFFTDH